MTPTECLWRAFSTELGGPTIKSVWHLREYMRLQNAEINRLHARLCALEAKQCPSDQPQAAKQPEQTKLPRKKRTPQRNKL